MVSFFKGPEAADLGGDDGRFTSLSSRRETSRGVSATFTPAGETSAAELSISSSLHLLNEGGRGGGDGGRMSASSAAICCCARNCASSSSTSDRVEDSSSDVRARSAFSRRLQIER